VPDRCRAAYLHCVRHHTAAKRRAKAGGIVSQIQRISFPPQQVDSSSASPPAPIADSDVRFPQAYSGSSTGCPHQPWRCSHFVHRVVHSGAGPPVDGAGDAPLASEPSMRPSGQRRRSQGEGERHLDLRGPRWFFRPAAAEPLVRSGVGRWTTRALRVPGGVWSSIGLIGIRVITAIAFRLSTGVARGRVAGVQERRERGVELR
jgi:hypothetical protein